METVELCIPWWLENLGCSVAYLFPSRNHAEGETARITDSSQSALFTSLVSGLLLYYH